MKAVKAESKEGSSNGNTTPKRRRRLKLINRASPQTTLELKGVKIHFPFRPYDCQKVYMEKVIDALNQSENALLESPTGTGKTLCLLCATLAWQRQQSRLAEQNREGGGDKKNTKPPAPAPTIIYASRTHSQLKQVIGELRNTRYRPVHALLGAREHMCVNPKVKKKNSVASEINHDCNKLGKERKCRYRNNLEGFEPRTEQGAVQGTQLIMDIEELVEMGKTNKVCPFYYTRSKLEDKPELILLPYNYLFDARETTLADIPWNNSIVIFDESHNLESFASESASFDLSTNDVAGCITETDRAMQFLRHMGSDQSHGVKMDNLIKLKAIFLNLENHFTTQLRDNGSYSGEFMMDFFQRGATINHANHDLFLNEIRKVSDFLMEMRGASSSKGGSRYLEHFALCLKRVYGHQLESRCLAKAAFYRVHVSPKPAVDQKNAGRTISYWCFAPSLAMEELAGLNIRSIIVTSGTLSPLQSYSLELGLKFPHTLENPHIIEKEQICVRVVGKGVSGKQLSSSYERRKDEEYYTELGNTLVSLAKVTPAGMLVFFPSYGVMYTCLERWGGPVSNHNTGKGQGSNNNFFAPRRRQMASSSSNNYSFAQAPTSFYDTNSPTTPWKRLLGTKSIVVEPKSSAELPDAIAEFRRYLALPRSPGCILMGVCRGKISEGIDFSHEQSRAVVITGLPFPPSHDPKVKMKRQFLDQARSRSINSTKSSPESGGFDSSNSNSSGTSKLSGHQWYTQQAHRAVNQAIGRVIRNSTDYGAVLLMDSRFDQDHNQAGLSKWLQPHIKKDEGIGSTIRHLVQFFKEADDIVTEKKKAQKAQAEAGELEYEDEDKEMTKYARIHKDANEALTTSYVPPEKVVARGDVKDINGDQPATEAKNIHQSKKQADYNSVFDSKQTAKPTRDHKAASKNIDAKVFYAKAMQTFSSTDFSTIKNALVAMNRHAKNNDTQSYARAAREIVRIVIHHEDFFLRGKEREECMLFQLFPLLKYHREDVELMAMKMTFDNSLFGKNSKNKLSSGYYGLARSYTGELLCSLWCADSKVGMNMQAYLKNVQEIFRLFYKTEGCVSTTMLKAFLELIPTRYVVLTQTLAQELATSLKMKKMKEVEKGKSGEASIKPDDFKRPLWDARVKASGFNVEPVHAPKTIKKEAPSPTTACENPYARKRPASNSGADLAAASRPRKTSLSSLIKNVESDTYVKKTAADLVEGLKNNAPKNLTCPMCDSLTEEPCVAECGHVGCQSCWRQWLKRSPTCPTCRLPATFENLALVVYETAPTNNKSQSSSKVLPRLSKSVPTTSNSADDELEIC